MLLFYCESYLVALYCKPIFNENNIYENSVMLSYYLIDFLIRGGPPHFDFGSLS